MPLTAGRNTIEVAEGNFVVLPVLAATKIFEGSLVVIDADGYAAPASLDEDLVAVGRAEEAVDNSGGEDGDVSIRVKRGIFKWDNADVGPVTIANVMGNCYISDDSTVTATALGSSVAGKVIAVESDGVLVETK